MSHPSQTTGKVRRKVKSGCRTCKIRKVKCDEGRPVCQRCLKSGRKCDGYGIWGGGGSPVNHSNTCAAIRKPGLGPPAHGNYYPIPALSRSPRAYPVFSVPPHQDEMEAMAFDWFKSRTATKLPGSYHSRFWDTLIFQATVGDEAVRHTALALGSFHRTRIMCVKDCAETSTDYLPAREGKFMLQHYVTAISQLRQLLSTKDKSSYRVALVVCIMFTALDFLRGHLAAAQLHLRNGLNVLAELQGISSLSTNPGPRLLTHCLGQEDCWIAEAYSRLHLQMQLWKPRREKQMFSLLGHDAALSSAAVGFRSLPGAWQGWEVIMNRILTVTEQARSQSEAVASLIGKQVSLRSELDWWLERYEYTDFGLPPLSTEKADALIRSFYSMAKIMVEICLQPGDEMAYDSQTDQFVEMLEHLLRLLTGKGGHSIVYGGGGPKNGNRFAWSIVDFGNIQPLYYIAIKCRVHRVRLQAVRLLEACSHREGIWDSWAAACVARKVMELEEIGGPLGPSEEFPLVRCPRRQELSEPELPASQRICDVEIEMEGTPMDTILLFVYKDDQRVLLSTYNSFLMAWEDM